MALKEYAGNAPATRLSGTLASGTVTNFAVITGGGTGYPTGATAPFVVVIDRGTALEEKILVNTRSGDTFGSGNGLTRGYDNTGAQTHQAQAVVEHVFDAASATEASAHVNTTTRDDHTQYLNSTRHTAIAHARRRALTFTVAGDVVVPAGDVDYICPVFVPVASGQTTKLIALRARINAGTSATVKLQKNGVDITGFTGIVVTTTAATTDPADVTLADNDLIALIVTAVSVNPKNMSVSLYLEDTQ